MVCLKCGGRLNFSGVCTKCGYDEAMDRKMKKMQKNLEEEASNPNSSAWSELEMMTEEDKNKLIAEGADGYWRYKYLEVKGGYKGVKVDEVASLTNSMAVKGWRLKTVTSHGQQRAYVSSQMLGQAPIEEVQLLLIFEKYIKF